MSATRTKIAQELSTLAASWSKDPFRPNILLQSLMQALSAHPNLTCEAVDAAKALRDNAMQRKVSFSRERCEYPSYSVLHSVSTPCRK